MPYVSADFTNVLGSFYAGMQIKMAHEKHTRDMEKEDAQTAFKSIGEWQNLYNAQVFDWAEEKGMDMESFDYKKLSPNERAEYNAWINERYPGAASNVKDLYNKYVTPTMKGSTKGPLEFIQSLISPDEYHLIGKTKDGDIVPKTKNGTAKPDDPILSLGINEIANRTRASLATRYGFNALTAQQVLEYASGSPTAGASSATASERTAAAGVSSGATLGGSSATSSGEGAASDGTSATNQDPAQAALADTPSAETEFAQRFEGAEEERLARALGDVVGTGPQESGYTASNDGLLPPEQQLYDTYSRNGENGPMIGQQFADTGQNPFSMAQQRQADPAALAGTANTANGNQQMPPPTYNDQLGRIPDSGIRATEVPISGNVRSQESLDETYVAGSGEYIPETNAQKWDRQIAGIEQQLATAQRETDKAKRAYEGQIDPRIKATRNKDEVARYQAKEDALQTELEMARQAKEEGLTNQQAKYRAENKARGILDNQAAAIREEQGITKPDPQASSATKNADGSSTASSAPSTIKTANGKTVNVPAGTVTTTSDAQTGASTTAADIDKFSSTVASTMANGTSADVDNLFKQAVAELDTTGTTQAINDVLQQAAGGIPLDGTRSPLTGAFVAVRNPAKRRMVAGLMMEMGFFGAKGAEATSTAMTYMQTGMMPDQITQHWEMFTKAADGYQSIWAAKANRSEALTKAGTGLAAAIKAQQEIQLKAFTARLDAIKTQSTTAKDAAEIRRITAQTRELELKIDNLARQNTLDDNQRLISNQEMIVESAKAVVNPMLGKMSRMIGETGLDLTDENVKANINSSLASIAANESDIMIPVALKMMEEFGTPTEKAQAAKYMQLLSQYGSDLPPEFQQQMLVNAAKYNNYLHAAMAPAAIMAEYVRNDSPDFNVSPLKIYMDGENMGAMGTGVLLDIVRQYTPFGNKPAQKVYADIKAEAAAASSLNPSMLNFFNSVLQTEMRKKNAANGFANTPEAQY
ncbi:MAG: hypothetical protein VW443_05230 [Pseudomonadales bacterium]